MSEWDTLDLGTLDDSLKGRTLKLRVRMPPGNVRTVRYGLTFGDAAALRATLAYLLGVPEADIDRPLEGLPDAVKARLFTWDVARATRPYVLDVIDARAYEDSRRARAVLQ